MLASALCETCAVTWQPPFSKFWECLYFSPNGLGIACGHHSERKMLHSNDISTKNSLRTALWSLDNSILRTSTSLTWFYGEHDWSRFDSPDYPKRVKPRQDHFFDHLHILLLPRNLVAVQFGCAGAELPKPMTPGSRFYRRYFSHKLEKLILLPD